MTSEELREPSMLRRVAASLARVHDGSGPPTPCGTFNSFRIVETYAATAVERGARLPAAYDGSLAIAGRIEAVLTGPEHEPVPCHNDLLAANFIRGDADHVWIVDWEYAGLGDRYFDLANFAVNNELDASDERELLHHYFDETPAGTQLASLALMKFMSDFREAMWGVVQSVVSELDVDFDEYAAKHFERMTATAADPDFDRYLEEVRGASA
jgi:thiamine kinase-like enzyme